MLFKQKYLCVLCVLMMFFVIASGGCGGSSNSPVNSNPNNPSPDNPGTPENPNTPDTPDNPDSPDNPDPNNPGTKYDFSILEGTWKASNLTGTITQISNNLTGVLSLSTNHSNTISISNVNVDGDTALFEGTSDIYMDIAGYPNQWEDEFGGSKMYDIGGYEYHNTSGNTWRMERLNTDGKPDRTIITFISSTTAQVERYREGSDYIFEAGYTITKQ